MRFDAKIITGMLHASKFDGTKGCTTTDLPHDGSFLVGGIRLSGRLGMPFLVQGRVGSGTLYLMSWSERECRTHRDQQRGGMKLPWQPDKDWPMFSAVDASGARNFFDVPEWASRLAGIGHWTVGCAANGLSYRSVVIVPIRGSSAAWIALGALMASLSTSETNDVVAGASVWFPPVPGRTRFTTGVVGDPIRDENGLFRIVRSKGKAAPCLESCPRDSFFLVKKRPNLDSARSARMLTALARELAIRSSPDACLMLEDAIQIAGNNTEIKAWAEGVVLNETSLDRSLMLGSGGSFAVCRFIGERRAKPDERAKVVIVDGPAGIGVLEDDSFRLTGTPAVIILTPDEFISGQPDSSRIANALADWGEQCEVWPDGLAMPGIGGLVFAKEVTR